MSALMRSLRALCRQLEILVLELLVGVLRAGPRLRNRLRGSAHLPQPRTKWLAVAGAVAVGGVLLTAAVLPWSSTARSASVQRPAPAASPSLAEPSPPNGALSAEAFAGAARPAPAAAPLRRLPQVDLNGLSVAGIPRAALAAYVTAARHVDRAESACRVRWWLLAGIGLVESDHARSGGSTRPKWNGIARPPIFGPVLNGTHGFAAIHDTDRGALDRDRRWDRAVGPMQFLPSTWRSWGGDDGHGRMRDPQDVRAAALAAAGYLCAGGADLSRPQGMATAVYSYNHSFDYVRLVLSVAARYAGLTPADLGVDRLPHDKPATGKKHKGASASKSAAPSSTPSERPAPSSPSASSSAPGPAGPSSSPGGPSLPPLPTPSAGAGVP